MRLYLAGPLFTTAEINFNSILGIELGWLGYEVYLPQENEPRNRTSTTVFEHDIDGLDRSDAVVANMDGPDPDSGTAWECAYAYKSNKPIVAYRTDCRGIDDGKLAPFNIMLSESATKILMLPRYEVPALAEAIDKALKEIRRDSM